VVAADVESLQAGSRGRCIRFRHYMAEAARGVDQEVCRLGGLGRLRCLRLDAVAVGVVLVLDNRAVGFLDLRQAVLLVPCRNRFRALGGEVAVVVPGVGRGTFEREAVAIVVSVRDRAWLENRTRRAGGAQRRRLGLAVADGVVAERLLVYEADRLRDLLAGQA